MNPELVHLFVATYLGSCALTGLALLAGWGMKHAAAAVRHCLYLCVFLALALFPVFVAVLPPIDLPILPSSIAGSFTSLVHELRSGGRPGPAAVGNLESKSMSENPDTRVNRDKEARQGQSGALEDPTRVLVAGGKRWATLLPWVIGGVWIIGFGIILTVQIVRWAGISFIASMAQSIPVSAVVPDSPAVMNGDTDLQAMVDRIGQEFAIPRRVLLLQSELAAVSMAWGLFRHWVILPADSSFWPPAKAEAVIRHEVAHIKRRDNLALLFVLVVCGFYWINPLVWLVLRRLHFERESSCDDAVLLAGTRSSVYAQYLLEVAQRLGGPKAGNVQPAVMAHSSDLKRRLVRVLASDSNRETIGLVKAITFVAIALLVTMSVSMLRFLERESHAGEQWAVAQEHPDQGYLNGDAGVLGMVNVLRFDGTNSHVVVPDSDAFDFPGDFTIEARIKVAELDRPGSNHILISKHRSHGQGGEWALIIEGPPNPRGRLVFTTWNGVRSNTAASIPGVIRASGDPRDAWHTIAFCYFAESHRWGFFVDGEESGTGTGEMCIDDSPRDLWIGWESNEPQHDFKGWIREMRVSEIARYASSYDASARLGVDSATVACWDFTKGHGEILQDRSGNGHDGRIVACTWDSYSSKELRVPPGEDLQAIVDGVPDGTLITLLAGDHIGPIVIDGRELTIRGVGANQVALHSSGLDDYSVLVKGGGILTLSDLRIAGCYSDSPDTYYYPAALTVDGGQAELARCRFENNLNAIAVWRSRSRVLLSHSTIVAGEGVAILTREAHEDSEVAMDYCTLIGVRQDLGHGLVKMWGGLLTVERCILSTPAGRAIEYHGGDWVGSCNIVHASQQASGGLSLPSSDHWNEDPLICPSSSWNVDVLPESRALPGNNACGAKLGSGGECDQYIMKTSWAEKRPPAREVE